jgi:hypothetical protein
MSGEGCSEPQTAGRRGSPKIRQQSCASSCTQRTPAGLPWGMPGMGEEIDGAMQQAAQCGRQSMAALFHVKQRRRLRRGQGLGGVGDAQGWAA